MKFKPLIPAMLVTVLLAACVQTEPAKPTVGVVDTARVFRDCAAGKAGVKFLEGLHTTMQAELTSLQEQMQKKPDDTALQTKLQELYMGFQQRMNAEQQQVVTLLNDALQRSLDAYRISKNLSMIIGAEAALSYDKAIDVTNDIIAEVDKQKVEFKPLQEALDTPADKPADKPAAVEKDAPADKPADAPAVAPEKPAAPAEKPAAEKDKPAEKPAK